MILLDTTTRTLEVDLTSAVATNQLPFVASYVDVSQSTFAMTAAATNTGATNSTTAVTLVAAPSASTTRQLKYLSIKNSDTAAVELWVQVNDNSTLREMWKGTLAVGDTLFYVDSTGWHVLNASGQLKASYAGTFTATRVPFADSGGSLTTDSGFTFNTTGDVLTVGALVANGTVTGGIVHRAGTYTNGDTTPSVLGVSYMTITNSSGTTITDFDDGVANQVIVLRFTDANTTINRSNCFLSGGANFVSTADDTLSLICDGTLWYEIGRGVNS